MTTINLRRLSLALVLCSLGANAQVAGFGYPPDLPDAKTEVYKTLGDTKLKLYIFNPTDVGTNSSAKAAIVFFFGGGWRNGSPAQFAPQCRRLASLGVVAITADYRVSSRQQSTVNDSIQDAKSAIRYVRENATRLGIDPKRIAAGGGSAGGHLAAATALIPGFEALTEKS
jgi:acetyl esterase/lipase